MILLTTSRRFISIPACQNVVPLLQPLLIGDSADIWATSYGGIEGSWELPHQCAVKPLGRIGLGQPYLFHAVRGTEGVGHIASVDGRPNWMGIEMELLHKVGGLQFESL